MGIVSDILASASYGQRTDLENPALWFLNALGGGTTTRAGERVSPDRAMSLPAFLACVRNIAEDVAKVPVEERQKRGRDRSGSDLVTDGAATDLLDGEFNPETLSFTGRETLTQWALTWRAGYAEIERDGLGRPVALWPIHPSRARLVRIDGALYLEVHNQDLLSIGAPTAVNHIPYADVLHIRGFGDDVEGYSLVMMAAEALGVGMAAQMFAASFFGNGAHASGVISWPETVSAPEEKTIRKIKKQWSKLHGKHANEPMTLLDGAKWTPISIAPDQAQFIETRKFQTVEFCRLTRMPPHMIQDLERATYSNIEHQGIEYATFCLGSWWVRWEKECGRKLLTPQERKQGRYIRHVEDALMRGDLPSRSAAVRTLVSTGVMTPNEGRVSMEMVPLDSPGMDETMMQGAMATVRQIAEGKTSTTTPPGPPPPVPAAAPEEPEAEQPPSPREQDVEALRPVIDYAAQTLIRKEAMATSRAAKRFGADRKGYAAWAARFASDLRADMAETFRPVLLSCDNSRADLVPAFDAWESRFTARAGAEFGIDEEASRLAADVARLIAEDKCRA